MAGIASMGSVGAGLSQAQFQVAFQARVLKEQIDVSNSLGSKALDLIQAVISSAASGAESHDLDVKA